MKGNIQVNENWIDCWLNKLNTEQQTSDIASKLKIKWNKRNIQKNLKGRIENLWITQENPIYDYKWMTLNLEWREE